MFLKLLPFELNLQIRQIGFMITCAIIFVIGFFFTSVLLGLGGGAGGDRIKINGALIIAEQASFLGLTSIFFGAIFVVSGVMRDGIHKSLEMIHATPIPTPAMILSRFTGVFLATFLSIFAGLLGLFIAQFSPWIDREILAPINPMYYIHPAVVLIAVNALFISAIFTLVATTTRQRALVYVSAVVLFIFYTIASSIPTDVAPKLLVSLLDPFGLSAMVLDTETWAAAEQNSKLLPLDGYLGINRAFWLAVSLLMFALSFLASTRGIGKSKKSKVLDVAGSDGEISLHTLAKPLGTGSLPSIWAGLKLEYLSTVKSVAFIILSTTFIPLFALFILVQFFLVPEPPIATSPVISALVFFGAATPMVLIAIFFGGEIVWRDRTVKVNELIDASPVRNWPLLASKWLALYAIILTLVIVGILIGMIAQIALGNPQINIGTYLSAGFVRFTPRILFFATLVMFIQNFMPNRIVGMIVGGLIVAFFFVFYGFIPVTHPLMNFGVSPGGGYSEMGGFANLINFRPFLIYWTALCSFFAIVSVWLWRRGLQASLVQRVKIIKSNMSLPSLGMAAASLIAFAGVGYSIYQGYNVENEFRNPKDTERFLAKYEEDLGERFEDTLPKVRDVKVDIQLYPSEQTAKFSGTYQIENATGAPLTELYLTVPVAQDDDVKTLTLQGATQSLEGEDKTFFDDYSVRRFVFSTPLAEGDVTTLTFDLTHTAPTLGGNVRIRKNGTFINNQTAMPNLGVPALRLTNPSTRRKYDLPKLPPLPDRGDETARSKGFFDASGDYITARTTICTDPGQTPFAPGGLIREYEQDGRPCREYQPREPISYFMAFMSADFERLEDVWIDPDGSTVNLGIYYDAKHDYNVEIMMQAMKDSLKVMSETFGPYQFDTLRIMEFPFGAFAQSYPNTIAFSENIGFVTDPGDPDDNQSLDLATYVTMHEIGHQWFGHQVIPATTEGFNVLSEGLTENAAMTTYQARYGWQKTRRVLERRSISGLQGYLIGQAGETTAEEPLATARGNQQYIFYAKANWVFWGLKHYIGEENMQEAIRKFVTDYGRKGPPYPTTAEFIDYLYEAAGPDYEQLVTDYWNRITFWDLALEEDETTLTANQNGTYTVDLEITLDKTVSSKETGRAVSVLEAEYAKPENDTKTEDGEEAPKGKLVRAAESLNEWVEIGFYENDPSDTFGDEWLKLERVKLTDMTTQLSFELDKKPAYVMLDPRRLLIETNVSDNEVELELTDKS